MIDMELEKAHAHCYKNKEELSHSKIAGCFYCCSVFNPNDIEEWVEPQCALCPKCGIDSVIGDASGIEITMDFLDRMSKKFFGEERRLIGDVIEESLTDKSILPQLKIIGTRVEKVTPEHKTPWLTQWTLHTIEATEENAAGLAEILSHALENEHPWYIDYRNSTTHYIIYKDKVFKVDRSKSEEYEAAKAYGIALGIPIYQLDDLDKQ